MSPILAFSMYKIMFLNYVTLKCRSMSAILELVRDIPRLHLYTKFGDPRSICSQVIEFSMYKITYIDLCDLEK